jgi:hypothetical protein
MEHISKNIFEVLSSPGCFWQGCIYSKQNTSILGYFNLPCLIHTCKVIHFYCLHAHMSPSFTDETPVYGRKSDTLNLLQKFPLNFHHIKNSHSASYHACILNSAIHNSCNGGAIYFQKLFLWFSCQSQWQPHTYYLK